MLTKEEIEAERRWMGGLSSHAGALCDLALVGLAAVEVALAREHLDVAATVTGGLVLDSATDRWSQKVHALNQAIAAVQAGEGK